MKIITLIMLTYFSQNAFSLTLKCIGDNIDFKGVTRSLSSEIYWENIEINKNILSVPKYGNFKRRSKDSIYWLSGDNWIKLVPDTGKFTISIQKNNYIKNQIQAKCSNINKILF
jgi:hypothetical protein